MRWDSTSWHTGWRGTIVPVLRPVFATLAVAGLLAGCGAGPERPLVEPPPAALPAPDTDPTRPAPAWLGETAATTDVPERALVSYATAALAVAAEQPGCRLGWSTLAAIGQVESVHGTLDGGTLGDDGVPTPPVLGIPLDGDGVAAIRDTDDGALDGDRVWDRAVGPMQFIPQTWQRWSADGDADGRSDPQDLDDAALAAARYLCSGDGPLDEAAGWTAAVTRYNNSLEYARRVAGLADGYAGA